MVGNDLKSFSITAPRPTVDASVCTINSRSKSGYANTGAEELIERHGILRKSLDEPSIIRSKTEESSQCLDGGWYREVLYFVNFGGIGGQPVLGNHMTKKLQPFSNKGAFLRVQSQACFSETAEHNINLGEMLLKESDPSSAEKCAAHLSARTASH